MKATFVRGLIWVLMALAQALGTPTISGFNPSVGAPGDQIQITGSGFAPRNFTVAFGNPPGVPVTAGNVLSDSTLMVTVPNGATTGPISIQQDPNTPFYTPSNFLVIGSGPYISGFFPPYGQVNDTVTVLGVHFANTFGVSFSGVPAQFSVSSDGTHISTRVPPGATNGPIAVSTINGTSNSVDSFTVVGPGPYISGFSPGSGDVGTTVQIAGLHFTGLTNVTFNGQPGLVVAATSDTYIQVQAPPGLTTGPIAVNTPLGSAVTTSNFFGKPTIAAVSPNFGRANTNVAIVGTNFLGATAVSFNGIFSPNFNVLNNSNLSVLVPAGATTGLIRVFVPGASTFSLSNFVIRPTLSGFSPAIGPVGNPVTITGANLNAGTPVVAFNGVQTATPTGVTFGQLTAQVPAGATTGPISVTTADGADTSANLFYLPGSISNFSPTNGAPGNRITIAGQNFIGATAVSFNGTSAAGFAVTNNTSIGATVPNNVITGPISVTTPAGVFQSSGVFYGAPVITNFTPTHGLPGTNVAIKGVNFLGGSVRFNGLTAAIISLNNTQMVATVPSGAGSGPITVSGPAGTNTSTSNFTLDYFSNLQVAITNSPAIVTVGSNLIYTISIVNAGPYAAPNTGFTNTLPANTTLVSATASFPWLLQTNGNVLIGTTTNFGNGNASTLALLVTPLVAGKITDTISVGSDNPDPSPLDNTASISTIVEPLALLSIGLLADQVKISWAATLTNYALQFADGFASGQQWFAVTSPPTISGGLKFVTETNGSSIRFYRLGR